MNQLQQNKSRYRDCFFKLKQKRQGAFVPFVMLGDPTFDISYQIITTLIDNGADALELGIPFSDPIADGPVIQAAAIRALSNGATVAKCLNLVESIRRDYPDIAIGLLVYSNLVVSHSIDGFYQRASMAGSDSVLIADLPLMESQPFIASAIKNHIAPIFIATPNADQETLKNVALKGQGYTYLLSRAGVTGTEIIAEMPVSSIIDKLKDFQAPPSLLGFGISNPAQVKAAIAAGADGVICGSAIVKIIEEHLTDIHAMQRTLAEFVRSMKLATMKDE